MRDQLQIAFGHVLASGIVYHAEFARITGGVESGIFLSMLFKWKDSGSDPEGWVYKTRDEIQDEAGLSRSNQETARRKLKKLFLVEEEKRGLPAQLYYRINEHLLFDMLANGVRTPQAVESFLQGCRDAANKLAGIQPTCWYDPYQHSIYTSRLHINNKDIHHSQANGVHGNSSDLDIFSGEEETAPTANGTGTLEAEVVPGGAALHNNSDEGKSKAAPCEAAPDSENLPKDQDDRNPPNNTTKGRKDQPTGVNVRENGINSWDHLDDQEEAEIRRNLYRAFAFCRFACKAAVDMLDDKSRSNKRFTFAVAAISFIDKQRNEGVDIDRRHVWYWVEHDYTVNKQKGFHMEHRVNAGVKTLPFNAYFKMPKCESVKTIKEGLLWAYHTMPDDYEVPNGTGSKPVNSKDKVIQRYGADYASNMASPEAIARKKEKDAQLRKLQRERMEERSRQRNTVY